MEHKKKKLTGQQGELMRALDITHDDLRANDNGVISPEQRESLVKRQNYQWKEYNVIGIAMTLFGLIVPTIAFFSSEGNLDRDAVIGISVLVSIFMLIGVTSLGYGFLKRQQLQTDLNNKQVATTQGIAVVNISDEESILEINGMKLNASQDVLRRIKHLDAYVIHYLPNTKTILSMEHIDNDDNIRSDFAVSELDDTIDDAIYMIDEEPQSLSDNL
ncbi:MAG: hypothetical protein WBC91_17510 [Phototrophicaceae bacterium]